MRYVLTKDFTKINVTAGLFQNLSGDGTCALAVLPFAETATDENSDGETANTENPATDTTSQTSDYYNFPAPPPKPPMTTYCGGNIFDGKPGHKPNFPPKKDDGLIIKISLEALANGQTKFVVELPDRKKG